MLLASLALALDLVPREAGHRTIAATVSTGGRTVSPAEFTAALLDCAKYPLSATYMGVQALVECRTLAPANNGTAVIYQRTGGNALVAERHWVAQVRVKEQTDTRAVVEWDLVKHTIENGKVTAGPYASVVQAHPSAVFTPYTTGSWVLDNVAGTVTYTVTSDPGGSLPGFMTTQGAVMAFPMEVLRVRWGIEG